MKIKNLAAIMGFRSKPRRYAYSAPSEAGDAEVKYVRWLHPSDGTKAIDAGHIRDYRTFLQPGDFCIDIGAHSGDSTLPMAAAVGKSGCVLALEPNPFVYHVLEKNARQNRANTNIYTMMAAAADKDGFIEFEYSDSGFCNGGRHEGMSVLIHGHPFKLTVFTVNLAKELESDFADYLPRLKFIKVDAEGYDLYVLRTLENVIKTYRPSIKAEIYKNTDLAYRQAMLQFFDNLGYRIYRMASEPVARGEEINGQNLMQWRHFDVIAVPQ